VLAAPVCPTCRPAVDRRPPPAPSTPPALNGTVALFLAGLLGAAAATAWTVLRPPPADNDAQLLSDAFETLTLVGTAAERYRSAQGRWPGTIDDLVPSQLTAVPPDPFGGAPLRLARDPLRPEGLVLYSVGPDRVDQGGRPRMAIDGAGDLVYPLD